MTVISMWVYNCYVIHDGGDGRPFVVDLGVPSQLPHVAEALRRHGSHLSELSAAVATHGHADHVGGLLGLRAKHDTAVLLPHAMDQMRAGTIALRPPGIRAVSHILPVLASQPRDLSATMEVAGTMKEIGWDGKGVRLPFEPQGWLTDGDHLPGLPAWQVLSTPGHSDDSTCLYHEPTRTLISGDTVLSVQGRAWFNPEYVDGRLSVSTEARLRPFAVEHLLPGHGLVVQGPRVMDDALSFADPAPGDSRLRALGRVLRNTAAH